MSERAIDAGPWVRRGSRAASCGAPLAADQRYCLNCGRAARRAADRLPPPPRDPEPRRVTAAPAGGRDARRRGRPEQRRQRDFAPLAAVGGIAVLGLMLLVGVLIGKGDGGRATAPAPPPVVRGGEGGRRAKTAAATASEGARRRLRRRPKPKRASEGESGGRPGRRRAADSGGRSKRATTPSRNCRNRAPRTTRRTAPKLPDEIATGGQAAAEGQQGPRRRQQGDGGRMSGERWPICSSAATASPSSSPSFSGTSAGLAYEMAIRDHFRLDVLTRQAAELQQVDAELAEVERMLKLDQAAAAGACGSCGALYARGSVFCWQCGKDLMPQTPAQVDRRRRQPS